MAAPLILGYMLICNDSVKLAWFHCMLVGVLSVAIAFLETSAFYSYPLFDWVKGVIDHSKIANARSDSMGFMHYFFLQPSNFMQGLLVPLSLFSIYQLTSRNQKMRSLPIG
jgi:hypothetical protein